MAYEVHRTITEDLDTGEFKFTGSERSMREDVGVDPSGAANEAYTGAIRRENHTGTQSADTIVDGDTNKVFTETQEAKLEGIAEGATQNSADATLLSRANHTGTQSISTLSDLDAELDSRDTANRSRANHTGDQAASTVTGTPDVSVTSTASSSSQSIEEWISELEQRIITLEGA